MSEKLIGFIDAGFLVGAGARCLRIRTEDVNISPNAVVSWLDICAKRANSRLLRAYWYDGIDDPKSSRYREQRIKFDSIEDESAIQVRLGHRVERPQPWRNAVFRALREADLDVEKFKDKFSYPKEYEQKGVDSLIVLDLVRLAQSGAYDIAVLVAGDRDLAGAVRAVQDQGKNVIIAAPEGKGISSELLRLADDLLHLNGPILKNMLSFDGDGDESGQS